jgi:hypothetical protein
MTHKPELNDGIETILLDQITPVAVLGKLVRNIRDNIPLSSDVIDAYYAGIPLYRGVIYINDLEKIPPLADKEFMIVAIDLNPDDNIIAHFVALRRDGDKAQYFNSYGTFVPAQIRAFVERSGIRSILSSERFIQPADGSALCGYYCLYVIDGWRQDKPYAEVIAPFRIADKGNKHDIRVLIDHFNRVPDDLAEELQKINV